MAEEELVSENSLRQVKIVLCGHSGSGKTNFSLRLMHNHFKEDTYPTVGASFMLKNISIDDIEFKIIMIDIAGDERYKSLVKMYNRDSSATVFMYDSTNELGVDGTLDLFKYVFSDNTPDKPIFVVGNKSDIPSNAVAVEKAQNFCQENGFKHFLSSAKTGENVENIVKEIMKVSLGVD
ncbi:hypothetical protein SteCoe_28466 [Stentor coeruleus]|uniref:Uncharacterized protein n=1 Tax=Stentor coeruleus TaxID=5963 RepID=A0A1R2B859_9CILI|nr:hypothetical protein SteCoe_28466 [Stentor coeruleus]